MQYSSISPTARELEKGTWKDYYSNMGKKNIVHYNLNKKPWQYDDVIDAECFWGYAKKSPFYELILKRKAMFGEKEKTAGEAMAREILFHANRIVASDKTFVKTLGAIGESNGKICS